jgi:predicted nuclease with RNAse H fold
MICEMMEIQPTAADRYARKSSAGHGRCWLGVDVGGERKGFDAALLDERELIALASGLTVDGVLELAATRAPLLAGVDSPCGWAADGETARHGELLLNRAVCGIRWTPDARTGARGAYYAWIRHGLAVFAGLEGLGVPAVEVFPTASWTRWGGPRAGRSRADWSRAVLASITLGGVPSRTNQDQRDAIAAALTARQHWLGRSECFGEIVVPDGGPHWG